MRNGRLWRRRSPNNNSKSTGSPPDYRRAMRLPPVAGKKFCNGLKINAQHRSELIHRQRHTPDGFDEEGDRSHGQFLGGACRCFVSQDIWLPAFLGLENRVRRCLKPSLTGRPMREIIPGSPTGTSGSSPRFEQGCIHTADMWSEGETARLGSALCWEHGLTDCTTHVRDRRPRRAPSPRRLTRQARCRHRIGATAVTAKLMAQRRAG